MMIGKIIRLGRRQLHTIISREIIKPSFPTPSHLQTYNLSELDQRNTHVYMPLILYYPNNENCTLTPDDKVRVIKKSLSQSLTRYYPLSGRLHTQTTPYIECDDEGVVFVQAKHDSQMNMLQHISEDDDKVGQLFVDGMFWLKSPKGESLLGVQVNHFACSGMAVAVSMSHKIGDGCTLCSFVSHWASVARYGSTYHKEVLPLNPHFIQSQATTSFLPPPPETVVFNPSGVNPVTKKFIFPNSKLTDLKNKVLVMAECGSTLSIYNPTRAEVLTSLLYKTGVAAITPNSSSFKSSYLYIPVDMRNKFVPKLPTTTFGNYIAGMLVTSRHESETSLNVVVSEIKKQKMELELVQSQQLALQNLDWIQSKLGNEDLENVVNRSFSCSSLCGLRLNKVDFGWGNSTLASVTYRSSNHTGYILMDTPNRDGIEAWVTLETQDMERFQNDRELLSFCENELNLTCVG